MRITRNSPTNILIDITFENIHGSAMYRPQEKTQHLRPRYRYIKKSNAKNTKSHFKTITTFRKNTLCAVKTLHVR